MAIELDPYRFTVSDYRRLRDSGIIADRARVELLDGLIVEVTPIDFAHARHHALALTYLTRMLGDAAFVVGPSSFALGELDMPEPDLAVLPGSWASATGEPDLTAVHAVIEIAQSSLRLDLGRKARLYARAAIPDYLVVDIEGQRLVHHAAPSAEAYTHVALLEGADSFSLLRFPADRLAVKAFFAAGGGDRDFSG